VIGWGINRSPDVTKRLIAGLDSHTTVSIAIHECRRRLSSSDAPQSPTNTLTRGDSVRCRTLLSLAAVIASLPAVLAAQSREITGKVTQAGTGTPITEATIGIVGAQVGVRTNERGEYRLKAGAGDVSVIARAIGFKRRTVQITASQSTADFSLEKDVLELEGVTVTGQATTVDKRTTPRLGRANSRPPVRRAATAPPRTMAERPGFCVKRFPRTRRSAARHRSRRR